MIRGRPCLVFFKTQLQVEVHNRSRGGEKYFLELVRSVDVYAICNCLLVDLLIDQDEINGTEENKQSIEFYEEFEVVVVVEVDLSIHDQVDIFVEIESLPFHGS